MALPKIQNLVLAVVQSVAHVALVVRCREALAVRRGRACPRGLAIWLPVNAFKMVGMVVPLVLMIVRAAAAAEAVVTLLYVEQIRATASPNIAAGPAVSR